MRGRMTVSEQVRNLERHAADIADLRGQHQKPMCGNVPKHWFLNAPASMDASEPYLKY